MAKKKSDLSAQHMLIGACLSTAVVLLVFAGCAWWGYNFSTSMVTKELGAQKIYFPPKGSPALDPQEYPTLQKYAGQQVNTGPKAKAYANDFIGKHLEKVAGGKTYSEISTLAMANPKDEKLQQQKQTLFQGETLRGLLLGNGYAFWTIGMIAKYAAIASTAGALLLSILGFYAWKRR